MFSSVRFCNISSLRYRLGDIIIERNVGQWTRLCVLSVFVLEACGDSGEVWSYFMYCTPYVLYWYIGIKY